MNTWTPAAKSTLLRQQEVSRRQRVSAETERGTAETERGTAEIERGTGDREKHRGDKKRYRADRKRYHEIERGTAETERVTAETEEWAHLDEAAHANDGIHRLRQGQESADRRQAGNIRSTSTTTSTRQTRAGIEDPVANLQFKQAARQGWR